MTNNNDRLEKAKEELMNVSDLIADMVRGVIKYTLYALFVVGAYLIYWLIEGFMWVVNKLEKQK